MLRANPIPLEGRWWLVEEKGLFSLASLAHSWELGSCETPTSGTTPSTTILCQCVNWLT
jgi:hypothetical protein